MRSAHTQRFDARLSETLRKPPAEAITIRETLTGRTSSSRLVGPGTTMGAWSRCPSTAPAARATATPTSPSASSSALLRRTTPRRGRPTGRTATSGKPAGRASRSGACCSAAATAPTRAAGRARVRRRLRHVPRVGAPPPQRPRVQAPGRRGRARAPREGLRRRRCRELLRPWRLQCGEEACAGPRRRSASSARSPAQVREFGEVACDGHAPACGNLAEILEDGGVGVPRDAELFDQYAAHTWEVQFAD